MNGAQSNEYDRFTRAADLPGRRWELSGLTELLALPWLWWSWLAVQFVGLPSRTLYVLALVAWIAVTAAIFHPKAEQLLARRVWRLRPPSALEAQRIRPAWFAVCAA